LDKPVEQFISNLKFPLIILGLMWGFELYEYFTDTRLTRWGIYPREWDGFLGILRAPFLHSDWGHLLSNSAPMLVLTVIMVNFYKRVAIPAFFVILVFTGFVVWLFARESYHVGASGVVYGLIAFVFWSGVFRRNPKSIILALLIAMVYGSFFQGIIPQAEEEHVSWESHLYGALVGIFTAFLFKNAIENDEVERPDPWANETSDTPFLPANIFEMTKRERYLAEQARLLAERQRQIEIDRLNNDNLSSTL